MTIPFYFGKKGRRSRGGLHRAAKTPEIVRGALRVRSSGEDGALVLLQDGQPVADIGGVISSVFEPQTEVRTQEGCTQLGDQLFAGIAVVSKLLAPEVPVQPGRMARPMGRFMSERRIVGLRVTESLEGRHLDVVEGRAVVSAIAAVTDIGARGGEEGFGLGNPLVGIAAGVGQRVEVLRQAFDLLE